MELRKEDLDWCIRRLPKKVAELVTQFPLKLSIGGGFIRSCITGDEVKDIDMFVDSTDTMEKVIVELLLKQGSTVFRSKNAVTIHGYKYPIQIIHRWLYSDPVKILEDFDFSIACSVIWWERGWKGEVCHVYYQDLAAKRLRYLFPNRDEDVGGSILRVLKYYRKGYNITLFSYAGIISRLMSGVRDAGTKTEQELTQIISGLLFEVDPSAVVEDSITREEIK